MDGQSQSRNATKLLITELGGLPAAAPSSRLRRSNCLSAVNLPDSDTSYLLEMVDDFLMLKERRFLGVTERRWIWVGRTLVLAMLAFVCGFIIYLGADRVQGFASSAWDWARFQVVGTQATPAGTLRRMGFCYGGVRINCVVDGDTIWVGGEKIRLQSIDAPEIDGKCDYEKNLARRAKRRLNEIRSAEPFSVAQSGTDRKGRTLAAIYNSRGEVGAAMVKEGLARQWTGRRRPWC